jgi:hypothetical protein
VKGATFIPELPFEGNEKGNFYTGIGTCVPLDGSAGGGN